MHDPRVEALFEDDRARENCFPIWWNFDTWIAGLIADVADKLITAGNSYPGRDGFDTVEKWHAHLAGIRDPLRKWHNQDFDPSSDQGVTYDEVKAVMHRFADSFGYWWD